MITLYVMVENNFLRDLLIKKKLFSQRFLGVGFGVYDIWFFGFFMLYAILENSLRIFLVVRNKSETIVKGIVTSFEGFKLFCLNYIC